MILLSAHLDYKAMLALRMALVNRADKLRQLYIDKPVTLAEQMGQLERLCKEIGETEWFESIKKGY